MTRFITRRGKNGGNRRIPIRNIEGRKTVRTTRIGSLAMYNRGYKLGLADRDNYRENRSNSPSYRSNRSGYFIDGYNAGYFEQVG